MQEVSAVGVRHAELSVLQDNFLRDCIDMDETIPFRDGGETKRRHLVPSGHDHNADAWCFVTETAGPDGEYPVAYVTTITKML